MRIMSPKLLLRSVGAAALVATAEEGVPPTSPPETPTDVAADDPRPAAMAWATSSRELDGDELVGMLSPTDKEGEELGRTPSLAQPGLTQSTLAAEHSLAQSTIEGNLTQSTMLVASGGSSSGGSSVPSSPRKSGRHVRFHKSPAFADIMKRMEAAVPGADDKDPLWQAIARYQAMGSDRHWVADDKRTHCEECGDTFEGGITTSAKHHCRHCGEIYCGKCAPERDPLPCELPPSLASTLGKLEEEQSYTSMGKGMWGYVTGAGGDGSCYRRCVNCEMLCAALAGENQQVREEGLRKWQAVESTQQLLNHRHILYRLPYHPISAEVKARLRLLFLEPDREYVFTGHSGWLMQLLLDGVDWTDAGEAAKAVAFISTSQRVRSCAHCCCTKDCKEQLRPQDIAVLLENLPAEAAPAGAPLAALLADCDEVELNCLLTTLVHNLSNPLWVGTAPMGGLQLSRSPLAQMLLQRAAGSAAVLTRLFWALELAKQMATSNTHSAQTDAMQDAKEAAGSLGKVANGAAFFAGGVGGVALSGAAAAMSLVAGGVGGGQVIWIAMGSFISKRCIIHASGRCIRH